MRHTKTDMSANYRVPVTARNKQKHSYSLSSAYHDVIHSNLDLNFSASQHTLLQLKFSPPL